MAFVYQSHQPHAMSRIPMRIGGNGHTGNQQNHRYTSDSDREARLAKNQLSPLQRLQLEYQEKLQLEKEKKITDLYEKWNDEALRKVGKYSGKRNRKLHANGNTSNVSGHYRANNTRGNTEAYAERMSNSAQQRMRIRKPQKLPPIENMKKASSFHSPETGNGHFNPRQGIGNNEYNYKDANPEPNQTVIMSGESNFDDGHSSPPPNVQHLRILRERRLKQKKSVHPDEERRIENNHGYHPYQTKRKLTDFENWQQEQDAQRKARLQKHYVEQGAGSVTAEHDPDLFDSNPPQIFGRKKKKSDNRTFVNGTVSSKRSASPLVRKNGISETKRNEVLRQGIANEKRIAELEREIRRKQMDLKKMQESENMLTFDVIDDTVPGSESEFDRESQFSSNQAPILKPVKVLSKRSPHSYQNNTLLEEEEVEMGFQMKPVIVRRDGSQGSSRGNATPQKDKTYLVQNTKPKRKAPKNQTFMTSNMRISEERGLIKPPSPMTTDPVHPSAYPINNIQVEDENVVLKLVSCKICGRKFTNDRLAKHTKVCSKNQGKKRKVFDMTKARTQGTDAEKFVRRKTLKRSPPPPAKKSDWRRKHEEFISTIKNAKQLSQHIAKGGKVSDLPPPPPSENPDYIKCQYCQRRFNPTVAQRHIPRCKDIKSRPKPPKRK